MIYRTLGTLQTAQPGSSHQLGTWQRRGAAVVEFAIIAPLFVAFIVGAFEVSRGIWAKQTLSDAARRACRTGSQPNTSNATIIKDVNDILTDNNIDSTAARHGANLLRMDAIARTSEPPVVLP